MRKIHAWFERLFDVRAAKKRLPNRNMNRQGGRAYWNDIQKINAKYRGTLCRLYMHSMIVGDFRV